MNYKAATALRTAPLADGPRAGIKKKKENKVIKPCSLIQLSKVILVSLDYFTDFKQQSGEH